VKRVSRKDRKGSYTNSLSKTVFPQNRFSSGLSDLKNRFTIL